MFYPAPRLLSLLLATGLTLAVAQPRAEASGKKKMTTTVRIHAEANAMDGASFTKPVPIPYPPFQLQISKIPIVSEWEIESYRSYPQDDGTFGALLNLSDRGKLQLETASLEKPRTFLAVVINGRMLDPVFIDRPVRDGRFYIRRGLTERDLELFSKNFGMFNKEVELARANTAKAMELAAKQEAKEAALARDTKKTYRKKSKKEEPAEPSGDLFLEPGPSDSLPVEPSR